ncbi:MAG: hypothetical protein K6C08_13480 [Oscillospiraceae bacterium]|nr:hypothetical protein [Oscillospiraceae bacterium]
MFLIICMITTFAPAAFAEGEAEPDLEITVESDGSNVTVSGEPEASVDLTPTDGAASGSLADVEAKVTNGEVTVTAETDSSTPAEAETKAGESVNTVEITVTGDAAGEGGVSLSNEVSDPAAGNVEATLTMNGNISSENSLSGQTIAVESAANTSTSGDAVTEVVLNGNAEAKATDPSGSAVGILVSASQSDTGGEAMASVTVNGGVSAASEGMHGDSYGVKAVATGSMPISGTAEVKVEETVEAVSKGESKEAYGLYTEAKGEGAEVLFDVGGVKAESENDAAFGASLNAYDGATVTATIGENGINAVGGDVTVGVQMFAEEGSTIKIESNGDIKAEGDNSVGISMGSNGSVASTMEVFVDGTVSGEKVSVELTGSALNQDDVNMTVWAAELVDNKVVQAQGSDEEMQKTAAAIEENIQYIIKIGEDGKAYDGLAFSDNAVRSDATHGYYVAKAYDETDTTVVNLKAASGYKLLAVVHGENDKTTQNNIIVEDGSGNYKLLIPKGGGLWLEVKLEKNEPAPAPEPAASDGGGYEYAVYALGTITAGDGSILTIYNTRNYTVDYADGAKEKGTYKFVYDGQFLPDSSGEKGAYRWLNDGLLIFTSFEQEVRTPEMDEDTGDATYTFRSNTQFLIESDIVSMIRAGRKFADIHISAK